MEAYLRSKIGKCSTLKEAEITLSLAETLGDASLLIELALSLWIVPVQAKVTARDILKYLGWLEDVKCSEGVLASKLDTPDDRSLFPLKGHTAAATKVNVFWRDVWKDARNFFPGAAGYLSRNPDTLDGAYNDQASGWLIWFCGVYEKWPDEAVSVIKRWNDAEGLKRLSDLVKCLGATETQLGKNLAELKVLVGRGAQELDRDEDVRCRVDARAFVSEKSCGIGEEIRPYVRQVLMEEMSKNPTWCGVDEYWSRRWLYTKAGSHARRIEDAKFGGRLDLPDRPTRREFSEAIEENVIAKGEPCTLAGQSAKLENGAVRAIYSGDTVSYYTFDYLLRPIEAVWSNRSCLLDPGARSQSEFYGRVAQDEGHRLMLDFEDYNSQHTKAAMKVVIEEATAGAPEAVRRWAVDSIDNEWVYWKSDGGDKSAKTVGGLFSGHRATTFINTVLNAAYIRMVWGELVLPFESYHAGDDVLVVGSGDDLGRLLELCLKSSLRFNRSKQSIGRRVGEFLRVAFGRKEAGGYLARTVSTVVSGNWVTEARLSGAEAATNYANQCWTLAVRSGNENLGLLLKSSITRRVPALEEVVYEVCTCQASINGSPVNARPGQPAALIVVEDEGRKMERTVRSSYATDIFIKEHINDRVLELAKATRSEVRRLMLEASYKPEPREVEEVAQPKVTVVQIPTRDYLPYAEVAGQNTRSETRTDSAAAKLLGRLMPGRDWEKLVRYVFGDYTPLANELDPLAWPVGNDGTLGVSELGRIKRRTLRPVDVNTNYAIRA